MAKNTPNKSKSPTYKVQTPKNRIIKMSDKTTPNKTKSPNRKAPTPIMKIIKMDKTKSPSGKEPTPIKIIKMSDKTTTPNKTKSPNRKEQTPKKKKNVKKPAAKGTPKENPPRQKLNLIPDDLFKNLSRKQRKITVSKLTKVLKSQGKVDLTTVDPNDASIKEIINNIVAEEKKNKSPIAKVVKQVVNADN